MTMTTINSSEYMSRIGFITREGENMNETFIRLHRCHSWAIPFENFDVFCGIPVPISLDEVFEKIVRQRRGGYCFELNLLFETLLRQMGYQTRAILCRPYSGEGHKLPLTHRMTIVVLQNDLWLADVGLGGNGWVEPLRLQCDTEQTQLGRTFRIIHDEQMGYMVQLKQEERFINVVSFGLQYAYEFDFEMSNFYTSMHPNSPFANRMICTLPTSDGRYSIRDTKFKAEINGSLEEKELTALTFDDILYRYFSIELTEKMNEYIYSYLKSGRTF